MTTTNVEKISVEEFHARLKAQGVSARKHLAMVCPMCGVAQSMNSLIEAGAGATEDEVEKHLGFSCVGRFTKAGPPRKKPDGEPCNWTLGGFFKAHELEIITADGKSHPTFRPATAAEAQALEASTKSGEQ